MAEEQGETWVGAGWAEAFPHGSSLFEHLMS